jgi:hypothetical protein
LVAAALQPARRRSWRLPPPILKRPTRDQLGRLALQPGVQLIHRAGGDQDARTVVVMALRMTIDPFQKRREP